MQEGIDAFQNALADALESVVATVDIYSHELNRSVFGTDAVISGFRHWIKDQPRAKVRIFIHESQTAMYRGNPLIELGLQLSSYFEFREPLKPMPMMAEMALFDQRRLVARLASDPSKVEVWEGHSNALTDARQNFDRYWHEGRPSQSVRSLHL